MDFKPLKLTWTLSSPICIGNQWPTADAIIAAAYVKEQQQWGLISESPDWQDVLFKLPIQKAVNEPGQNGSDWVYMASYLFAHQIIDHEMHYLTKRHDVDMIADHNRKGFVKKSAGANTFDTARTFTKNAFVQFPTLIAEKVSAYVIGDPEEIGRLLDFDNERGVALGHISAIGGRVNRGYGTISRFEMVEDDKALAQWKNRPLTWAEEGFLPEIGTYQNPYWDTSRQTRIYVPNRALVQNNEEVKIYVNA